MKRLLLVVICLAACGPSARNDDDSTGDDAGNGDCADGDHQCSGDTFQTCSGGVWTDTEQCTMACDDNFGCTVCEPGTGTCNGDNSHACRPDGSGYYDEYCDPVMGSSCDPNTGICVGPCSATTLGQTYIGCDYYATQSSQLVDPSFMFAIAVSNTTGQPATVTVDGGILTNPITLNVAAGAVATQTLPWVPGLKRCMTEGFYECGAPESYGGLVFNGGYHVRSNQPVTVYQFSPLDYVAAPGAGNSGFSYSNDASLLLPTNAWTGNYVVASWPAWDPAVLGIPAAVMPSVLTVTAYQDATSVTITSRANTTGGDGAPSFTIGAPQTVTLNAGDVIELMSSSGDLTGSIIAADKGVQVVAGHHCTDIPATATACDHIEESVFATEVLSTEYLVTAPYIAGSINGPRIEYVRVIATTANTQVSFDPAVAATATLANVGDWVEVPTTSADFKVTANHKVLVSQYNVGQDAPPAAGAGDPDMTLAVPIDQYRTNYQFHAPTNYADGNYVNITATTGTTVMLDGTAVPAGSFTPIGTTDYSVARVLLSNAGTGTHTASSTDSFGIQVYGYGQYTSYWYPGGLDLATIPVP